MNDLTKRERDDLDRHLTGNHGEDSVPHDDPDEPACCHDDQSKQEVLSMRDGVVTAMRCGECGETYHVGHTEEF